ncbi:MAG TPA: ATP-binding protein, partial [Opitutaceae bacterium]|nr:ATP-binding protein [Opitutaceae bacterium]
GDLETHARQVLRKLVPLEKKITGNNNRVYLRRILPYRIAGNRIEGVVVTFIDISEYQRAEGMSRQSQEHYRLILDEMKEYAVMMLDRHGRISTWTKAAEHIYGYSADEIVGRDMALLFPRDECEANVPAKKLETARKTGSVSGDGWRVRKDGSRFWATGIVSALYDDRGGLYGYVKVTRDNTEKKKAEEAVEKAKEAAEAATEAKNQFLANVAHELRTPPAAVYLQATLLEKEGLNSPERLREGLAVIKRSAEEQKKLIEDLVDTARISAGKLRLEMKTFALDEVARGAVDTITPEAKYKGVTVEHTISPSVGRVRADPHRLHQILRNLLDNAVKFTPKGGYVHLKISRRGTGVEIKVTDTGIGIEKDFLPAVFDRFGQAEPSGIHAGGLGLGLAITKELVMLHGGTIAVHSAGPGKGATFTVALPLPAMNGPPDEDEPSPHKNFFR